VISFIFVSLVEIHQSRFGNEETKRFSELQHTFRQALTLRLLRA
jgi:hypothetical protein